MIEKKLGQSNIYYGAIKIFPEGVGNYGFFSEGKTGEFRINGQVTVMVNKHVGNKGPAVITVHTQNGTETSEIRTLNPTQGYVFGVNGTKWIVQHY